MKTDSEISALFVYEKLYGISDRLPLSLAPAAILVPPPKMAFRIVLGGEFFCQKTFGKSFPTPFKTFTKGVYENK